MKKVGTEQKLEVTVFELEGSANELGYIQGKYLDFGPGFERLKLLQQAVDAREAAQLLEGFSPSFLDELAGLARGAEVETETAIQLFSGYNVVMPPMGCSTYSNGAFYVRNYDFSDKLYDARLVFQRPAGGYASVGFSQQVLGRLDGMNEKGLVIGLHFVNNQHKGDGFLATTICRIVLDQCATVEEAVAFIHELPQRYCYNYSILDRDENTAMIEAAPDKQIVHRTRPLICTNHFEAQANKNRNKVMTAGSIKRKDVLQNLISIEKEEPSHYYKIFNNEQSPLFSNHYEAFFGTLHTVVYCPEDLSIIVGVGGDCEPFKYSFEKWMEGRESLPGKIEGKIKLQVSN